MHYIKQPSVKKTNPWTFPDFYSILLGTSWNRSLDVIAKCNSTLYVYACPWVHCYFAHILLLFTVFPTRVTRMSVTFSSSPLNRLPVVRSRYKLVSDSARKTYMYVQSGVFTARSCLRFSFAFSARTGKK